MLNFVISVSCFFLFTTLGYTQTPIGRIGFAEGLSNETVRSIYKDKQGFMWFGTLDGLNRYDGYAFKIYRNRFGDSTSIIGNMVSDITEDHFGNLWLASRQGVSRLNKQWDNFSRVRYKAAGNEQTFVLEGEVVKVVKCDPAGNILIGSELKGLMFCSKASLSASQIPLIEPDGRQSVQYGVQAICFDRSGRTYVFVQGKGLAIFDEVRMEVKLINSALRFTNSMLSDGDSIWLATNDGIYNYHQLRHSVSQVLSVERGNLKSNLNIALAMDSAKNLWIGTMGGGVNVYNLRSGQMQYFEAGFGRFQITSNGIYALNIDNESRVWIGTQRGGVNIVDRGKEMFKIISQEQGNPNSLSGNFVTAICELPDSIWLISTEGGGLNVMNRKTGRFTHYKANPSDLASISSNNVNHVFRDHFGEIWVATFTNGICSFSTSTGKFKRYRTINQKTGIENNVFQMFYEDGNKTLWATALRQGNFFGGLYRYNRQIDQFELFDENLSDLFYLKEDPEGNLWGGNISGIVRIDRLNRKHRFFPIGQFVRTLSFDSSGKIWLGTEGGGLVLFDKQNGRIEMRYTTDDGLCNNSIFSMMEDDDGNLWLGTFNGLSKFNISKRIFRNFFRSDGLESDQFHFNAAVKLSSGAFAFGGIKGINVFYPNKTVRPANHPPLVFTNIEIDGSPVAKYASMVTFNENLDPEKLKISFSKAVLSVSFAALEYSVPNKVSYAFFLEGWDRNWQYCGNNRNANYTHLKEGTYTLRVKCTDANGEWGQEIMLKVVVLPPWYRTIWAYMFYLSIISTAVFAFLKYKANQARLRYEVGLEKMNVLREKAEKEKKEAELALEKAEREREAAELANERTQRALEQSEREAEKVLAEEERRENERRKSFFSYISHEFRTPLTLIINPIRDILEQQKLLGDNSNRELEIVYRNARRMLSLTNQLLILNKEESGLDRLRPQLLDFNSICYEVFLCFVHLAKNKGINLKFISESGNLQLLADRDKLEVILYNLLSNALKYTPEGGEVEFRLTDSGEQLVTEVGDTGPGIQPGEAEKIFGKFYQAQGPTSSSKPGFGIGLYLARQFTLAHNGRLEFKNKPGGGALFSLTLPKAVIDGLANSHESLPQMPVANGIISEITDAFPSSTSLSANFSTRAGKVNLPLTSEKQSLLIIDDDDSIREYLSLVFQKKFNVYVAQNGVKGIEIAKKNLPDIIISDIMMEGINGIDLCKSVKDDPALGHIPVILLTATSDEDLKLEGLKTGADDYITKPFDKELLMARVDNLLKYRNSLQKYFYNEVTLSGQESKISEQYRDFLETCMKIVESNLDNDAFNPKQMAKEMGISHSSLAKKVKAISGLSLNVFIRFIRLRNAARLFIDTDYNVNEVASIVGILDMRYFREQFHKLFGLNPSEYIRKFRKPFANRFKVDKNFLNPE